MDEMRVKIYKRPVAADPVMIAGWPGMGSVALGVVDYLRTKLKVRRIAEIETDRFETLDAVLVEDGLAFLPEPPRNTFYYCESANLIIFEGEAQPQGAAGVALLNKVLDLAVEFKVKRIFTGAAFPSTVGHKEAPEMYGAANKLFPIDMIVKFGLKRMEEGYISGLNGLVLGFAEERGIEAVCLLATMPQYAISLPNPRASVAIIEALGRILRFTVDLKELNEQAKEIDEKMAVLEEKVKSALESGSEEHTLPRRGTIDATKAPEYIVKKIEQLFAEAKADKTKAIVLKRELDRWDLYRSYEDRFLDLFKRSDR